MIRIKLTILIIALFLCVNSTFAQRVKYIAPLNTPLSLSGNFGEIRYSHFHAGFDFKTGGVIGKKVVAVADGYVSRISVSGSSYGNALYITHTDGTMSVYAHLYAFCPKVNDYVRKMQYKNKKFAINLYPKRSKFPVKKGQTIALSGNSGSSGAPHLHFEIRNSKGVPLSIAKYYKIKDNIKPIISAVYLVEIDSIAGGVGLHRVRSKYPATEVEKGVYKLNIKRMPISKPSYFAVEVTDRKNNSANTFGIVSLEAFRNDNSFFKFEIGNIPFSDTRYINTLTMYPLTLSTKNDILRVYKSENNRLPIYDNVVDMGVIYPQEIKGVEDISLNIKDDAGNMSSIKFQIIGDEPNNIKKLYFNSIVVNPKDGYVYNDKDVKVKIPSLAIYDPILFSISCAKNNGHWSRVVCLNNESAVLHKPVTLSILEDYLPVELREKAMLAKISDDGTLSAAGGEWRDSYVTGNVWSLAKYCVLLDTVAPTIKPLRMPTNRSSISFALNDDFSGIKSYKGTINGKWVLFEYDAKNKLIKYILDKNIKRKSKFSVCVEVIDNKNNITTYKKTYKK